MHDSRKMRRSTAILAAVLIVLSQILDIAARLSSSVISFPGLSDIFDILISVLFVVVLFRRRKDTFAGVVFLLSAIGSMFSVFYDLLSICLTLRIQDYGRTIMIMHLLMGMIMHLLIAAFRAVAAVECLGAGHISIGRGRILLWLLPLLGLGCALAEQMILSLNRGMLIGEAVFGSAVYIIPQWLGPVFVGVALVVPTRKKTE